MKYIQKTWVRILISLLAGGFVVEVSHLTTGDPNRPSRPGESYYILIIAFITFFILTVIVNRQKQ